LPIGQVLKKSGYFIDSANVWAQQNGLGLGQVKADDNSNNITAFSKLLILFGMAAATILSMQ